MNVAATMAMTSPRSVGIGNSATINVELTRMHPHVVCGTRDERGRGGQQLAQPCTTGYRYRDAATRNVPPCASRGAKMRRLRRDGCREIVRAIADVLPVAAHAM